MELTLKLDDWFNDRLDGLRCSSPARAYIVQVLARPSAIDMSRQSIVLAFQRAQLQPGYSRFVEHQRIGDWVLWASAMVPASLKERELAETMGRMSYLTCHRLIRSWALFEELADNLPTLARTIERRVNTIL